MEKGLCTRKAPVPNLDQIDVTEGWNSGSPFFNRLPANHHPGWSQPPPNRHFVSVLRLPAGTNGTSRERSGLLRWLQLPIFP